ncbi:sugar transporter [Penicillium longicatenatum]|uniref:sugar transporter n=1 Tax=Penicillium longicatenatum TaxID=1561947 RepID=UPI0025489FCF|nr:sugar transporter [Penicillium longicatenatum]KAJ5636893.1 sugar transporter [Penicillium longicatenatum]
MTSAFSFTHLIVSRVVVGLGVGGLLSTVLVWQAEISPAAKRGTHVTTSGIFASIGGLFALALDLGMSFAPGSVGWRFPMAFQALLSLMTMGFTWVLPESPRWLMMQNRVAEAREVFTVLGAVVTEHPKIENEIQNVQSSLNQGENSSNRVFEKGPQRIFHRTIIAASLLMFAQCTGIDVVGLYTNIIFESYLNLDPLLSRVLGVVYQIVSLLGGIVCVFTVDGLGRRTLMLSSATGNAICMALVAGLGSQTENKMVIHGSVVFISLFHFTFIVGFAGVPLLYASEIAPLKMRGTINGISISTLWAFSFLITEVTPIVFEANGCRFFIVFATSNVIIMAAVYFLFPETSGHTLEEIDQIFISSKTIWEPVWVAKRLSQSDPEELQRKGHTTLKV